jgi:hypothetical protein
MATANSGFSINKKLPSTILVGILRQFSLLLKRSRMKATDADPKPAIEPRTYVF